MDAQTVLTAKGAADYVAKYISKYGAGSSVAARIGSILDDIITRQPENKTMTITQLMSKAFIATAVPDALCCLEAWHLIWDLERTICTRNFVNLNLDDQKALKGLLDPQLLQPKDGKDTKIVKIAPVERYLERFNAQRGPGMTDEWLDTCSLGRFHAEVLVRNGGLVRQAKPRVVKHKPFLQLDMAGQSAGRMARMALRLARPFSTPSEDPWHIREDADAIAQLQEFVASDQCPRWMQARYNHANRVRKSAPAPEPQPGAEPDEDDPADEPPVAAAGGDGGFPLHPRNVVARAHGMRWEQSGNAGSCIEEAIKRAKPPKPAYLKELVLAMRPGTDVPKARAARAELAVHMFLQLDLERFRAQKQGTAQRWPVLDKPSLPRKALVDAAAIWRTHHPQPEHQQTCKDLGHIARAAAKGKAKAKAKGQPRKEEGTTRSQKAYAELWLYWLGEKTRPTVQRTESCRARGLSAKKMFGTEVCRARGPSAKIWDWGSDPRVRNRNARPVSVGRPI